MHSTEQKILSLFKKVGNELSTSQILEQINPYYLELRKKLKSARPDDIEKLKDEIAQIHRKTLYHLNKLIEDGIVRLTKHGERGEKFFCLNIDDNEEIIITKNIKRRIIISKPSLPSTMPIEGYEQKKIVLRYEAPTWIDRLNSVIIECNKIKSPDELYKIIYESVFPAVNDAICLENFNSILNKYDTTEFLEKLNQDSEDYGKKINLIINFTNLNRDNLFKILKLIENKKFKNIILIFNLNNEEIQEHFEMINKIIDVYSSKKMLLYIKNKSLQKAPYFIGRAGPYCIDNKSWVPEEEDKTVIACSQSCVIIDVNRFYIEYGLDTKKFSELLLNVSKSILSANSLQRRKSEEYFRDLISLNSKKEFLSLSKNYIRFWNYGLSQPNIDPELVINMISEAKKRADGFAIAEETIYRSCGMPTRFKLAFSCAFKNSDTELSPAKYSFLEINGLEDIYKPKIKKEIVAREIISEIFDGGNDVTFHRLGTISPEDIIREISIILNTYKIPLFSIDFEKVKLNLKITDFMK